MVTEMEWWNDANVTPKKNQTANEGENVNAGANIISTHILCLPSQYGIMWKPFDKDMALWAS
jgi:hypothetical protein